MTMTLWLRAPFMFLMLCLVVLSSYALRIPVQPRTIGGAAARHTRSAPSFPFSKQRDAEDIGNLKNFRYTTNITVNGVDVCVVLDTGSTDLWVMAPGGIGQFNDTGIPLSVTYGDGSYGNSGTIGVSPFVFGSYSVENQAFLNVTQSTIVGLDSLGIYGGLGLSLDPSTASPISNKIKELYGTAANWGQSVLRNIFHEHPDLPKFVAIDLSRTVDVEDTQGGSFDIGEYHNTYAAITNSTKLAQYPPGSDRWTTLLEGIFVDGQAIKVASGIPSVPEGAAKVLLDTGDPTAILPTPIADAIYSRVPGAALCTTSTQRTWVVPCDATTIVEFLFSGVKYPIHPIDLATLSDPVLLNGKEWTACVAAFQGVNNWAGNAYDISLGVSFLRNVYTVFNFGDLLADGARSEPYMQLLSQTDPASAIAEVQAMRAQSLEGLPPPIDPATVVQQLGCATSSTSAGVSTTVGFWDGCPSFMTPFPAVCILPSTFLSFVVFLLLPIASGGSGLLDWIP